MKRKQDVLATFEGIMGDGLGNVQVTEAGKENFSYVRINDTVQKVLNTRIPLQEGIRVIVGYDASQPGLLQVLGTRSATPYGNIERSVNRYAPASYYEWMGSDPIFIDKRLWLPRRISCLDASDPLYTGLSVRMYWDMFWDGTDWIVLPSQVIDLSSYTPASGKTVFVLITLNAVGAIVCTKGDEVTTADILPADIPAPPSGAVDVLAAVRLYYGQTDIVETIAATDILDLRFTYFSGNGSSGGVASLSVMVTSTATIAGAAGQWYGRASIADLGNGLWILCYYQVTTAVNSYGQLHIRFTDDYGTTWSDEDKTLVGDSVIHFPMWPSGAAPADPYTMVEPWLYIAPNGDLLLHMWKYSFAPTAAGTWQSRSIDQGLSWSEPAQVDFTGIVNDQYIFSTDDYFVLNGVIYACARVWTNNIETDPEKSIFIKSVDSGITWEYVSDISTFATSPTYETGIEYLGNKTIIAILRDQPNTHTYQCYSIDLGLTWGALTDVQASLGLVGRPRIHTRSHLKGYANWWNDPVLIMTGFVSVTPGAGSHRRNAIWISLDSGTTWTRIYIDDEAVHAGYADIAYDAVNNRYVVISYQQVVSDAILKQYNLTISGSDWEWIGSPPAPTASTIISARDTKTNIESFVGSREEMSFAYATDTNEFGVYTGGFWTWISGGSASGELLMQDGVASPPVPLETEDQVDWLYEG
jgi:hypothetical protein